MGVDAVHKQLHLFAFNETEVEVHGACFPVGDAAHIPCVALAVSKIDADPEAFQEMDARLGVVNRLKRKYRVERPSDLEKLLDEKKTRLADLENRDEKVEELTREIAASEARE